MHPSAKPTLSETTTGIKSFLLNLMEPFFGGGERGNGSTLPIAITGTQDEPNSVWIWEGKIEPGVNGCAAATAESLQHRDALPK